MTMQNDGVITHHIPNNRLQAKNLSSWTSTDYKFMLFMGLLTVASVTWARRVDDGLAWLVGIVLVLMWTMLIFRWRGHYDRTYRLISSGLNGLIRIQWLQKGVLWQAEDTSSSFVRLIRYGTLKRSVDSSWVWPIKPVLVEAMFGGRKLSYGLLRQKDSPFDHLVIRSSGAACVGEDPNRQTEFVNELAAVLNNTAAISSLKVGLSLVGLTGPADMTPLKTHIRENVDPTIARTEDFVLDEAQKSVANFLGEVMASTIPELQKFGATTNWFLIVVTIKRDSRSKRAVSGKMTDRQITNLPIVKLGQSLCEALQLSTVLQMHDAHCLGIAELSSLIRSGWDTVSIHDYHNARLQGVIPSTDEALSQMIVDPGKSYYDVSQAFPKEIISIVKGESLPWCLRIDDNYIATLRFEQIPKEQAHVAQFLALRFQRPLKVWIRMSSVGQSVSGELESKLLYHQRSLLVNVDRAMAGRRVLDDPNKLIKRRQSARANESIAIHSVAQHYHKLCCVVAPSIEELEDAVYKLVGVFEARGFKVRHVSDIERQFDAFMTASYAVNRM